MVQLSEVHSYWNDESCGEVYAVGDTQRARYEHETQTRYELEPYIPDFARFPEFAGKDVLEIGVGMGSDHSMIAKHDPKSLTGIDLTERGIAHTRQRLDILGLNSDLAVDDAENLSFGNESFDAVYSWGVLHHSPDTPRCFSEVHRVLRKGGVAKVMIYHKYSPVGFALWLRYALGTGRPFIGLTEIYSRHLESPGTKAYTVKQARALVDQFEDVNIKTLMSFGDLLEGEAGRRHGGRLIKLARLLWPKAILKSVGNVVPFGLYLLIEAKK